MMRLRSQRFLVVLFLVAVWQLSVIMVSCLLLIASTAAALRTSAVARSPLRRGRQRHGGGGGGRWLQDNSSSLVIVITANDDSETTTMGTPVTIPVLANDSIDGDNGNGSGTQQQQQQLQIISTTDPAHGSVVINTGTSPSTITYTPTIDFVGVDTFEYTVTVATDDDNNNNGSTTTTTTTATPTATATVTITVSPGPNNKNPPTARDDTAETPFQTAVVILVLQNDNDDDGDAITVVSSTDPAHGSAVINTDSSAITYTPNPDFVGTDSFFYTITDGKNGFGVARVTVTVVPPPNSILPVVAVDDVGITTAVNTAVTIDVLDNDRGGGDGNNGPTTTATGLTILAVTRPSNGVAAINNNNNNSNNDDDPTITYTPNTDFVGMDTFSYRISNSRGDTDTAQVQVQVVAGSLATSPPPVLPPPPTAAPTAPPVATPAPTSALGLPHESCLPAFAQCQQNTATCFNELGNFDTGGWYNTLERDQPFTCDLWIQMQNDCSGGTIIGTVTGTATYDAESLNARYYFTYNITNGSLWSMASASVNAAIFQPVPVVPQQATAAAAAEVKEEYTVNPNLYSMSKQFDPMKQNTTGSIRVRCPEDKGNVNAIFYAKVCRNNKV